MISELYIQRFNNFFSDYKCEVNETDYARFELNRNLLIKIAEVEHQRYLPAFCAAGCCP